MRTLKHMGLAAVLLFGAAACEEEREAPPPPLPKKVRKPVEETPAESAAGPSYVYAYNPTGKRDPFRAQELDQRPAGALAEEVCKDPLCQYDLEQLTLVAVITGGPNPIAMVEDPQGRGFTVRRNTRMGKRGGKVSAIRRDEVTVTEFWTGPDGKVNPSPVSMKLAADEKRAPDIDLVTGAPVP